MDCGLRVLDSGYFVIGTCIPDSKAKDSSIHKYKLSEFWNPDYFTCSCTWGELTANHQIYNILKSDEDQETLRF